MTRLRFPSSFYHSINSNGVCNIAHNFCSWGSGIEIAYSLGSHDYVRSIMFVLDCFWVGLDVGCSCSTSSCFFSTVRYFFCTSSCLLVNLLGKIVVNKLFPLKPALVDVEPVG